MKVISLRAHANNKKKISKHMGENKRSKQFEKKKSLYLEDVD
jgi:hypothetical protein